MQRDRHLSDPRAVKAGLDDHLRGKLHTRAALVQSQVVCLCEPAEPAVDVMDRRMEPRSGHRSEHRIPPPAVKWRHGAGQDRASAARQPAALHQIVSMSQLIHESWYFEKVITVVRIAHNDESTLCGRDAAHQGVAITSFLNVYNSGSIPCGDLLRAIRTAV